MDLNKNIPASLSHAAPAGPRRMLAHLFGLEGKAKRGKAKKRKNKGKKKKTQTNNPNLPTYQPNVKAAKLFWKQAATALYHISRKQTLADSPGLGLFPNTGSLQSTPNLNHQTHRTCGICGPPSPGCRLRRDTEHHPSNRRDGEGKASCARPKRKARKQNIECRERRRK